MVCACTFLGGKVLNWDLSVPTQLFTKSPSVDVKIKLATEHLIDALNCKFVTVDLKVNLVEPRNIWSQASLIDHLIQRSKRYAKETDWIDLKFMQIDSSLFGSRIMWDSGSELNESGIKDIKN